MESNVSSGNTMLLSMPIEVAIGNNIRSSHSQIYIKK
jgi:hypothetical protein